ncbi:unnamed protein product [Rotaria magnacalcarata]|uniref:S-adenosylmethionine sensor upstream of mTORC1 n=1 Tax=Rotaria magnacalcarata TaxID=392030 RepID=A0A815NLL9_9BILA|nr:unnamed protein product [Rotaria magnacalcarata]CAF2105958.1 unnamed protein product [Rotaria magnacalcarata]CAF3814859.1 unnamed protein product [Rotaria magnacalcarata]
MSAEQLNLAESIKKVHQQLRNDVNQTPEAAESIWNQHVANTDKLNEYAKSMRQLAQHHWAEKAHGQTRLTWCYKTIKDYFFGNEISGLERKCARDKRKQILTDICADCQIRIQQRMTKPRVLDVGSCYNAFSIHDDLETIAIDIAPADESVHRIDFLRVPQPPFICAHSFDAIIFSLVLDYLPTCHQRLSACLIAHELLTCLGLLLIVEPDSTLRENRQKLWRQALESIGFGLVSNIKVTNLYCMAFRKITQQVKLNEDEHERISQLFNIPQDIMNDNESSKSEQKLISVDEDLFGELPFSFD